MAPLVRPCVGGSAGAELLTHGRISMAISIEQAKKLLNNKNLSDKQVEQILSACKNLTEVLFEKLQAERISQRLKTNNEHYDGNK